MLARTLSIDPPRLSRPPTLTLLLEDGLEVALEHRAGILEVLLGVGLGGGDALKRLVEDADDPLLLGERWERERHALAKLVA